MIAGDIWQDNEGNQYKIIMITEVMPGVFIYESKQIELS